MTDSNCKHSLVLNDRRHAEISGVSAVGSFDEGRVVLDTAEGILTLEGEELHIVRLDLDRGEVAVEGRLSGFFYSIPEEKSRGGFFSRLVK